MEMETMVHGEEVVVAGEGGCLWESGRGGR